MANLSQLVGGGGGGAEPITGAVGLVDPGNYSAAAGASLKGAVYDAVHSILSQGASNHHGVGYFNIGPSANTWTTAYSLIGSGIVSFLAVNFRNDDGGNVHYYGVRFIIDGTTVLDTGTTSYVNINRALSVHAVGSYMLDPSTGKFLGFSFEPIPFSQSIEVQVYRDSNYYPTISVVRRIWLR